MAEQQGYSYIDFLYKNPLYLHNNKEDFYATVKDIDISKAEDYLIRYIVYLRKEEGKILKALGGKEEGKIALKKLSNEITKIDGNLGQATMTLSQLTARDKTDRGVNFRALSSYGAESEDVGIVYGKNKYSKGETTKYKQNMFLLIPGGQLHLFVENRWDKGGGKWRNDYNFQRSLNAPEDASLEQKKIFEEQIKEFNQALNIYINTVKNGLKTYKEIIKELGNFMNLDSMDTKDGENTIKKTLSKYINGINEYNGTITEQFLEFLLWADGAMNSTLKGSFNEAAATKFSSEVLEELETYFGKGFTGIRGDQREVNENKGTNKKPDIIYFGGYLGGINDNPITISMKAHSSAQNTFKTQTSALWGENGRNGGIIGQIQQEEDGQQRISKAMEYLSLNDAFIPYVDAYKKIKLIYKYFSYTFLSGSLKDERKDQAVFFMETTEKGGKPNSINFYSMADILINIYENSSDTPFKLDRLRVDNENGMKELRKLKWNIYKEKFQKNNKIRNSYTDKNKKIKRIIEWTYKDIYDNKDIKNLILSMSEAKIFRKVQDIKMSTSYLSSRGIII